MTEEPEKDSPESDREAMTAVGVLTAWGAMFWCAFTGDIREMLVFAILSIILLRLPE